MCIYGYFGAHLIHAITISSNTIWQFAFPYIFDSCGGWIVLAVTNTHRRISHSHIGCVNTQPWKGARNEVNYGYIVGLYSIEVKCAFIRARRMRHFFALTKYLSAEFVYSFSLPSSLPPLSFFLLSIMVLKWFVSVNVLFLYRYNSRDDRSSIMEIHSE